MQEKFKLTAGAARGYQVVDRQDPSIKYGVVWYDPRECRWVAEYPGHRPGSGGGIPGFATKDWAARFLYRYDEPQPSERDRPPGRSANSASPTGVRAMATFGHATAERCTELGRALTAAGLAWSDNGRQDDPQFLTYTVTDPGGRTWKISPATNFQISPSSPAQIWQADCAELTASTPVLSARTLAEHISNVGR
ncbi:hypothetical protein [Streptomyces humi]